MDTGQSHSFRKLAPAIWCVGLGLLFNALVFAWPHTYADTTAPTSMPSQTSSVADSYSNTQVTVIPTQISSSNWGFVLVDSQRHTLAVYEIFPDVSRLKLIAVRDFQGDFGLQDFNNSAPTPAQVKSMLNSDGGNTQ